MGFFHKLLGQPPQAGNLSPKPLKLEDFEFVFRFTGGESRMREILIALPSMVQTAVWAEGGNVYVGITSDARYRTFGPLGSPPSHMRMVTTMRDFYNALMALGQKLEVPCELVREAPLRHGYKLDSHIYSIRGGLWNANPEAGKEAA